MHDENKFLDDQGRLQQWPSKQTDKLLVLAYIATKFDRNSTYSEERLNILLKQWHTFNDWALLRRELVERGFIDRNLDGTNYHLRRIETLLPGLLLVGPNIQKDPEVAVYWLDGAAGRETLRLMGNIDEHNKPSSVKAERERVRNFITSTDQRTWMLNYRGKAVGVIWVNLKSNENLQAPSVHLMIGDPDSRGLGIGHTSVRAVINLLREEGNYQMLYSRHLTQNKGSAKLLAKVGFTEDGAVYHDADGLAFQNVKLKLHK